jgi:hypothetical protein
MSNQITPVSDPIYDITKNSVIGIDSSTNNKMCTLIPARIGGSGSTSAPINNATGTGETLIEASVGSNYRIRWGTSYLRVGCVFSSDITTPAALVADKAVPSWNQIPYSVQEMSVNVNKSAVNIFDSVGGTYVHNYTARMLSKYSSEKLETLDNQLFTPVFDDFYCNTKDSALSTIQKERFLRWVSNNAYSSSATAGSLSQVVYKHIPLTDLIDELPDAIMNNIESVRIQMKWKAPTTTDLEVIADNAETTYGTMLIVDCALVLDNYVLSATELTKQVSTKGDEFLNYMQVEVTPMSYVANSDLILSGKSNVQAISVMNLEKGATMYNNTTQGFGTSSGQLLLFNQCADSGTTANALKNLSFLGESHDVINSIQVQYGSVLYPNYAIPVKNSSTNNVDLSTLYSEYVKALNIMSSGDVSPIPYANYKTSSPFVLLSMFSNNAPHFSTPQDVIIKITGGCSATTKLYVVLFRHAVIRLSSDGSVMKIM